MKSWESVSLPEYTKKEETLNIITHAAGLVISACILAFCLVPAIVSRDTIRIVCASLYLFGTTVMFVTSVIYHAATNPDRKKLLRVIDHCTVFFSVAGTVTGCVPVVYDRVGKPQAILMLSVAWLGVTTGLLLTLFIFEKTKAIRMCLYIGTALVCAIVGAKAYTLLPVGAFLCFLIGSSSLLLGAVFLRIGRTNRYFHAVFHICIDIGLAVYFIGISKYCF